MRFLLPLPTIPCLCVASRRGELSIVVGRRDLFSGWDALLVPRRFLLDLVRLRGGGLAGGGGDGDGDVSGV